MEKTDIKVSVCISVYNGAKYIERCLDSVCNQTLKKIEIVVVNDGSTDNSLALINEYVQNHPERQFVVISKENGGLCRGRISGISHASGEYITFLDQDDYVETTAYEKMLNCAEQNHVDIVEVSTKYGKHIIHTPFKGKKDSHDVLRHYFSKGDVKTMLWLRMYHRSLFEKQVLPDIYTNNEDMFGMPCLFHTARSIFFLDEPLHTYSVDNEFSYMKSMKINAQKNDKKYESFKIRLLSLPHFVRFVGKDGMEEYEKEFSRYQALYSFAFLMSSFYEKKITEKVEYVNDILGFVSYHQLKRYLLRWLPAMQSIIYGILGINATYCVYLVKHKLIG